MKNELKSIFYAHTGKISDKWLFYLNEWDSIFSPYKEPDINLLEIGIQNGGSLEIWAKYFENAKHIVGCDIDEACLELNYEDPRITVIVGDINSDEVEDKISSITSGYNIIIDDGSHKSGDIIQSFAKYFSKLNINGIYLIEDLHTSYWRDFQGGLYDPYSALSFLKRLADIINFEHWRTNQSREQYLWPFFTKYNVHIEELDLCSIKSIKFLNSMCVIKKQTPNQTKLGQRVVVGSQEKITQNYKRFDGTSIHDITVTINEDSNLDVFSLIRQVSSLKDEKKQLIKKIDTLEQEVLFYANSRSWKLTKPFRRIMKIIRGKTRIK